MNQKNRSSKNTNAKNELPEPNSEDLVYTTLKAGLNLVPIVGGGFAEMFGYFVTPPLQKRRDQWFEELADNFLVLANDVDAVKTGKIFEDEVFLSTFLQATRYAYVNHRHENLNALRNGILNSALPSAPDDVKQKIFIEWAGTLTDWHLRILFLFRDKPDVPRINLENPDWQRDIAVDNVVDFIEKNYPEKSGNFHLSIQITKDLHNKMLISNSFPEHKLASRITSIPEVTDIGKEFLAFIESPIEE